MNKPILGITMGDPFGNGPEITVKALADKTLYDRCRPWWWEMSAPWNTPPGRPKKSPAST